MHPDDPDQPQKPGMLQSMSKQVEYIRAIIVLTSLLGSIGIGIQKPDTAPVVLTVLSGAIGGYFGNAQANKTGDRQ
jgi:hypothetical protein